MDSFHNKYNVKASRLPSGKSRDCYIKYCVIDSLDCGITFTYS